MKGTNENQFGEYHRWTKREISLLKKSYKLSEGERKLKLLPELLETRTRKQCCDKAGWIKISRNKKGGYYSELNFDNVSKEELAYLAGIIDGEGNLETRRGDKRPSCKVNIGNTSLDLMNWIQSKIGGSIYKRKPVKKLSGEGYRKQQYEYHLYGIKPMLSLLRILLPYFIVKKNQAIEIINYFEKKIKQ